MMVYLSPLEVTVWHIGFMIVIVLPRDIFDAIPRRRRTLTVVVNFNRRLPVGKEPTTELAREIWAVVEEFQPAALLDLHEGWGIYRRHDSVGQTLITYPAGDARRFAEQAVRYLNTYHVKNRNVYRFRVVGTPVAGSLARKAGADLSNPAFIAEATAYRTLQ